MPDIFKTKIMLKADDDLWSKVSAYKVKKGFNTKNEAVNDLIKKGLLSSD